MLDRPSPLQGLNDALQGPRDFWRITMNGGGDFIVTGSEANARDLANIHYGTKDCVRVPDPGLPVVSVLSLSKHRGQEVVVGALDLLTYLDRADDWRRSDDGWYEL